MNLQEPVVFKEFQEYVAYLAEGANDDFRMLRFPQSANEFESWWRRISLCSELCERWTKRIRLRERFVQDLIDEITSIGRAA